MVSQPLMLDLLPAGREIVWVWFGSGTWCHHCISYSVRCHAWQRRKHYRRPSQSSGMGWHPSRLHPVAGKWSDFSEHLWGVDLKLHSCSVTCQQPYSVRAMLLTPALGNCPQQTSCFLQSLSHSPSVERYLVHYSLQIYSARPKVQLNQLGPLWWHGQRAHVCSQWPHAHHWYQR